MKKLVKSFAVTLLVLVFWFLVWLLIARYVGRELLFPSPWTVCQKIFSLSITADFWLIVGRSIFRVLLGILLAVVVGITLALLTSRFSLLHKLFYPLISVVKATPVASFIILALLWLGSSILPVFIAMLIVLPIIWSAISDGIAALDKQLFDVCRIFAFPFGKRLRLFYLPTIMPYFLSACKTSVGMAWKAGVAAEVLAVSPVSIGKQLSDAKLYLETEELFAWTAVVVLLSLIIEKVMVRLLTSASNRYVRRESHVENK